MLQKLLPGGLPQQAQKIEYGLIRSGHEDCGQHAVALRRQESRSSSTMVLAGGAAGGMVRAAALGKTGVVYWHLAGLRCECGEVKE